MYIERDLQNAIPSIVAPMVTGYVSGMKPQQPLYFYGIFFLLRAPFTARDSHEATLSSIVSFNLLL